MKCSAQYCNDLKQKIFNRINITKFFWHFFQDDIFWTNTSSAKNTENGKKRICLFNKGFLFLH